MASKGKVETVLVKKWPGTPLVLLTVILAAAAVFAVFLALAVPAFAQREAVFEPPEFDRTDYDVGTGGDNTCGDEVGELCPTDIANADFDDDGNLDLVTANRFGAGNDDITVFENDGDGDFDESFKFGGTVSTFAIDIGFFDGDELPDVVVADPDSTPNNVWVFLNESDGNGEFAFSDPIPTPSGGVFPADLVVDDFDDNNDDDVAVSNNQSGEVVILLGDGDGDFTPGDVIEQDFPLGVDSGNFDGEDGPDLVVTSADLLGSETTNTATTYLNDGDGDFALREVVTVREDPGQVIVADLNSDDRQDLAVSNFNSDDVSVALGRGNGTFRETRNFDVGDGPYELAVGDYNRDGAPNIAVRNQGANDISILVPRDRGGQDTLVPVDFDVGQGFDAIGLDGLTTGDFEGRRGPDLATTNFVDDSISVLLNATSNNDDSDDSNDSDDSDDSSDDTDDSDDSTDDTDDSDDSTDDDTDDTATTNQYDDDTSDDTATDDQYDDDTSDDDTSDDTAADDQYEGDDVTATADDDDATATTDGTSARAGGDPDEQAPVSGPRGDVLDEIATDEPLPPTGGVLPWTGGLPVAALAAPFGVAVLGVALAVLRFGTRWR